MPRPLPCPVWVTAYSDARPPRPGVLLEWEQRPDARGHLIWWGRVMQAHIVEGRWYMSIEWHPAWYLRPVEGG